MKDLRDGCEKYVKYHCHCPSPSSCDCLRVAVDNLESFAREIRNEALDQVLAGISREQSYREFREDQDGSGVGACKEIASYVRALKSTDTATLAVEGKTK